MVELLVRKWKLSNLKPNGDEASEETRMIETPIKQRRPGPSVKIEILVDDKSSSAAGKGKHWKESKRSVRHSLVKGAMRWAEAAAKALPGVVRVSGFRHCITYWFLPCSSWCEGNCCRGCRRVSNIAALRHCFSCAQQWASGGQDFFLVDFC
mmetsp:Transcript_493/g.993  ORF Transcript_493/g.993 Transcript_493/m.993 type:complete len:152 (+) Transcript_493:177-632(+)